MRKGKTLALAAAIILLFVYSCGATSEKKPSLLWKISGNGLAEPSYLFGTHHLVPLSFLDSVRGVEKAFRSTAQTVGELDLSDMSGMQTRIMGEAMMPDGTTYARIIPEEDAVLLDSMLRSMTGVGLEQLGRLKPAMLANLISVSLYKKYYPSVTSEENLDNYFQKEAQSLSRQVVGLETAEDQINLLLNAQPLERQADMLVCLIKHPDLLKKQMDELQQAYHSQDIDALQALYEKEDAEDPCPSTREEERALNGDRNQRWLEKLPALMKEKPSFIAVGCLHLPGSDGLIEGLRKMGYRVEPVTR